MIQCECDHTNWCAFGRMAILGHKWDCEDYDVAYTVYIKDGWGFDL